MYTKYMILVDHFLLLIMDAESARVDSNHHEKGIIYCHDNIFFDAMFDKIVLF